jgi:hypothetical protein
MRGGQRGDQLDANVESLARRERPTSLQQLFEADALDQLRNQVRNTGLDRHRKRPNDTPMTEQCSPAHLGLEIPPALLVLE